MDAVTTTLATRQEFAFNGLKQAAAQDKSAVALVEQAVAEGGEPTAGTVTTARGSNLNIVV